jgi:sorbitol-specific phosphotransferase system component IIBC
LADGCLYTEYYYKGLGGPYFECESNFTDFTSISNFLVYYKKGQETWGNPLVITRIPNDEKVSVVVYPNPSEDNITVKLDYPDEYTIIELIDIHGKINLSRQLDNAISIINVKAMKKGLYLYKILNNHNLLATGKIILK